MHTFIYMRDFFSSIDSIKICETEHESYVSLFFSCSLYAYSYFCQFYAYKKTTYIFIVLKIILNIRYFNSISKKYFIIHTTQRNYFLNTFSFKYSSFNTYKWIKKWTCMNALQSVIFFFHNVYLSYKYFILSGVTT